MAEIGCQWGKILPILKRKLVKAALILFGLLEMGGRGVTLLLLSFI